MNSEEKYLPWMVAAILGIMLAVFARATYGFDQALSRTATSSQLMAGAIMQGADNPPMGICMHVGTGEVTARVSEDPCPAYTMLITRHAGRPGFLIENP